MNNNILSSIVLFSMIVAVPGLLVAMPARSVGEPVITSVTPGVGPEGMSVSITGYNFDYNSNYVSWEFGNTNIYATGAPSLQDITVILRENCLPDTGCIEVPKPGYINLTINNDKGTSNAWPVLITTHGGSCWQVDDINNPTFTLPVECQADNCVVGACEEPTPEPTPTPTPDATEDGEEDDEDIDDEDEDDDEGDEIESTPVSKGRVQGIISSGPSKVDKKAADFIPNHRVVATVDRFYRQVYGYKPSVCASDFWKKRARSDKATESKLLGAMSWQKSKGKNPAFASCTGKVADTSKRSVSGGKVLVSQINALFRLAHSGVNPTVHQNQYWVGRIASKKTQTAMLGAMRWHSLMKTGY